MSFLSGLFAEPTSGKPSMTRLTIFAMVLATLAIVAASIWILLKHRADITQTLIVFVATLLSYTVGKCILALVQKTDANDIPTDPGTIASTISSAIGQAANSPPTAGQ